MGESVEDKMEKTKTEVNGGNGSKKAPAKKAAAKGASAKKAAPKKEPAKTAPKKAASKDENIVTLAELAGEAKLKRTVARAKLRAAGLKCEGRWQWGKGSGDLAKARKALGLS